MLDSGESRKEVISLDVTRPYFAYIIFGHGSHRPGGGCILPGSPRETIKVLTKIDVLSEAGITSRGAYETRLPVSLLGRDDGGRSPGGPG
jgi:hypothetical protein